MRMSLWVCLKEYMSHVHRWGSTGTAIPKVRSEMQHWWLPDRGTGEGWGFELNFSIKVTSWVRHQDGTPPWNAPGKLKSSMLHPKQLQVSKAKQESRWRERVLQGSGWYTLSERNSVFNLGRTRLRAGPRNTMWLKTPLLEHLERELHFTEIWLLVTVNFYGDNMGVIVQWLF